MATSIESTKALKMATYTAAKKLAAEHGVTTPAQWRALAAVQNGTRVLPKSPDTAYPEQWESWQAFLGVDRRIGRAKKFWTFAAARKHVRALGLTSQDEFLAYARSASSPLELPVSPQFAYKGAGWRGFADFLGVPARGVAASRQYWPYEQTKTYAQKLNLTSTAQWLAWAQSDSRPAQVPVSPQLVYHGKGWAGWAEFLGEGYQRVAQLNGLRRNITHLSYAKAREVVAQLGLQTAQDFRIWARSGARPEGVPVHPDVAYAGKSWKGWSDFLGHEVRRRGIGLYSRQEVLSYGAAQSLVRSLKLKSAEAYVELLKEGKLPNGLPAQPAEHYAETGWTTWNAFLGTRGGAANETSKLKVREDGLLRFVDARKFARGLKLPNASAWFQYAASARRPVYIPREPWKSYFQDGYSTLEDFIGLARSPESVH